MLARGFVGRVFGVALRDARGACFASLVQLQEDLRKRGQSLNSHTTVKPLPCRDERRPGHKTHVILVGKPSSIFVS